MIASAPMLVGRRRELERLDRALAACASGRGGMLALCGDAGIGKTRLADELAERAAARHGLRVAWGRAWETQGAPPFWPWIECVGAIAERLEGEIEMAPALRALVSSEARASRAEGLRADPERERFELFEGVAAFLRAASREAPHLLVLDDLHAADVASLELLAQVARGLRASRVVVLGTWRVVEARRGPGADALARIAREADVVPLEPLPAEDVAEIVRHELGAFDAALAARVFDATEGNPLFVREAVLALALSRGASDPLDALREGGGVAALVRSRLGGASAEVVAHLEAGAVLGREIDGALLAAATGAAPDAIARSLDEGVARGLLVPRGGRCAFTHVLVREAIYRALPPARRRALHHGIAGALRERVARGREEHLATLAHHAIEALPDGGVAAALEVARRAAERARAQLAHGEAITLLERALAAHELHGGEASAERAELLIALGWAETEGGRIERGREVFREVAAIARRHGDARQLGRAALGQGGAYVSAEVREELVVQLRQALDAIGPSPEPEDRRLSARLLARLAGALTPSPEPEEPLRLARLALALTEHEPDVRTRIDVGLGAGSALIDFAPPAERVVVDERLLRDARLIGDRALELRALTRLACAQIERGDAIPASATIEARAALGEALGGAVYRWATPLLRSMRAMLAGRFDECEALADEAAPLVREAAPVDPNAERCLGLHRLCTAIVAGRPEGLAARMAEGLRVVESIADPAFRSWIVAIGASALGDAERAREAIRALLFTPCASKSRNIRAMMAHAAASSGAREESAAIHDWMVARAEDEAFACWGPFAFVCGPPIAQALAASAFACGRREAGVRHAEAALALCARVGAPGHEAWARLTLGEGLASGADAAGSRAHLERALALGTELGMPVVVARARAALGAASVAPAAPSAPAFTLTKRGAQWIVACGDRSFPLKDLRGVGMIARLIASPGQEIHALDLASPAEGAVDAGDAGELLDARAREAYRARVLELRAEIEEAERFADHGRLPRLRHELDALTQELARAVGLGGRARRSGAAAERARITVQRRVREAIQRIGEHDPELGRHLDWTIRTGTFCAYEPEGRRARS